MDKEMKFSDSTTPQEGGGRVGSWWQYMIVLLGVQALLLMIFKRSSWIFSKEERPLRLRPTLSRIVSFTSPAIAPVFYPVTRRHSSISQDEQTLSLPDHSDSSSNSSQ